MGFINNQRFKIIKLGVFIIDFEDDQDKINGRLITMIYKIHFLLH